MSRTKPGVFDFESCFVKLELVCLTQSLMVSGGMCSPVTQGLILAVVSEASDF